MSFLSEAASILLQQTGLQPFGIGMPMLSKKWCSVSNAELAGTITFDAANLALNLVEDQTWFVPITAHTIKVDAGSAKPKVTLTTADGSSVLESGLLFELFPAAFQRLKRLYIKKLEVETPTNYPGKPADQPLRPVPRYFFIASGDVPSEVTSGWLNAGANTNVGGNLRFFDQDGHIIHPLMVASCFSVLANAYAALVKESTPDQLTNLLSLQLSSFTVRLIQPNGMPYQGQFIEGKTDQNSAMGWFNATPSSADAELAAVLTRQADTGASGAFPQNQATHLHFGLHGFGRLGSRCGLPALPEGTTLAHDFFTVMVVDTRSYLTGSPDRTAAGYAGSRLEPAPLVRLHENLALLPDGNSLMGRLQEIFGGAPPEESLVCAPDIQPKFALPSGADLLWSAFPPAAVTADDADFPADFKQQVVAASTAVAIAGSIPDVKLTLAGLPVESAVRVYNRFFSNGAVLRRGDGAGGVASTVLPVAEGRTFNGQCVLRLSNPLGLEEPFAFSPSPVLIFDLVVVQRSGKKRIFGSLEIPINTTAEDFGIADPVNNAVATAAKQGVCRAGLLGLQATDSTLPPIGDLNNLLNVILRLAGETSPRDAPRMPTMARRDLLAAAKTGVNWQGLLASGSIAPSLHSAQQTLGSPGSQGGPETQHVGVFTQNAQLAYDVARMAFRRTTSFYDRIQQLNNALWDEPAPNAPLPPADDSDATRGTFAGAVLQNIAPFCETPEFGLLKSLVDANLGSIPTNWNALVDRLRQWIAGLDTSGLGDALAPAASALRADLIPRLEELRNDDPGRESQSERLYNELLREISAACYGRRDSQWALEQGIQQARHFIYIETPGLSFTQGSTAENYSRNLIALIQARIATHPGLKVIFCVPKFPAYSKKYAEYQKKEVKERFELINNQVPSANVVCFHPIGFPGRPTHLESHVCIVDDVWALVGSSMFSRRGLTFDGSADLVFTDLGRLSGVAPTIAAFRKKLMATRLAITGDGFDNRVLMLESPAEVFHLVRQTLRDGGLGRIEPVWNGRMDGVTYTEPLLDSDLVNPEGVEFQFLEATLFALLGQVSL